jgi:hypothetical protein
MTGRRFDSSLLPPLRSSLPMAFATLEKYRGQTRRLLLAFDIGTTFSGISYRSVAGHSLCPLHL